MKPLRRTSLLPFCLMLLPGISTSSAQAPAPGHRFEKDIAAFAADDRANPPPSSPILFVGDSTFTRWKSIHEDLPGFTIINRGFGGSQMSDLLFFTDRIVLAYRPRLIVVQEGGNDLHSGRTPEQFVGDVKAFVEKVRSAMPRVPIVFGGLAPSLARWDETETRRKSDRLLQDYLSTQQDVTFVDFFTPLLSAEGQPRPELFVEDRLHPSALGYQLRAQILRPLLGVPEPPTGK
jgi:lysophospholipase L1-like esterase